MHGHTLVNDRELQKSLQGSLIPFGLFFYDLKKISSKEPGRADKCIHFPTDNVIVCNISA